MSIESGIGAVGFRRIASIIKEIESATEIYFIPTDNLYSLKSHLFPSQIKSLNKNELINISKHLADSDLIAFSSMTASSKYVEKISEYIKKINPATYIIWGGIHPTLYPNESLKYVDAICVGEGEIPIKQFIKKYLKGKNFTDTPNFWFKEKNFIKQNPSLPLIDPKLLSQFPLPYNGLDCSIYDIKQHQFRQFNKYDYTTYNGLLYRTLWTLGCPFNCAYCANDSFIKIDPGYRKLRFPNVNHIINEIKQAIKVHPYIRTIAFYDDNFVALPLPIIQKFCQKYKKEIDLPFVVFGFHPNLVDKEKIRLLAKAGMNRTRMGIQSGAQNTLKFFNRPTTIEKIIESTTILANAAIKYRMIPPAYDIISDIPIESNKDIYETLQLIHRLKKPFTLTVFSLRIFPKTQLYGYVQKNPVLKRYFKNSSYLDTRMTFNNILLYLLATFEIPNFIFKKLSKFAIHPKNRTKEYPTLFNVVKIIYLTKRGIDHLSHFDFSTITGKWIFYVWKIRYQLIEKKLRF
ncbi:MAG: radical SAM protein [Candidatus Shapirobacteria bacterium]|nr:radical SAM protein [Candidatus Shapirobacteria bacterium]